MRTPKSLLLVTVDCLRADHVGFMGYDRPTTPFLDSLATESFIVPKAIVAGAPTYYSLPAILASRFPLSLGRDVLGLFHAEPTLATVLKRAGYATGCFVAGNPYISPRFGYESGFDTFRDFLKCGAVEVSDTPQSDFPGESWARRINRKVQKLRPAMGLIGRVYDDLYFEYCQRAVPAPESLDALRRFPSADVIVDHALEWVSSIGESPFFLWLHFMDPHSPYYPKASAIASVSRNDVTPSRARYLNSYWNRSDVSAHRLKKYQEEVVDLYDAGVRWVDDQIARLARFLAQSGQWQGCVMALTADHGEEFLDHGGRYHPPDRLAEELIHVPLLLRIPGNRRREQQKSPFSLIHLGPTLLDSVGALVPVEFKGKSQIGHLLSGHDFDGPAISESVEGCTNPFHLENRKGPRVLSVRTTQYKLLIHFGRGSEALYDLEHDPEEMSPVPMSAEPSVRRDLLEVAREHLRLSIEKHDEKDRLGAILRELRLELPLSSKRVPQS